MSMSELTTVIDRFDIERTIFSVGPALTSATSMACATCSPTTHR